ncbi:hypothetical protein AWB74_02665 [Caballeronia arvi]|uniref:Uncharacterized protein n=2 Tax=Caballeronia arvi TaxID=1777135 RepID=A0A158IME0_9BURK|nr:hypothetical protein AWB74_02665 [Caballeronia arvi]
MACRGVYKASGATFFRNARIDGSVSAMMDAYGLVKQEIIKDVPNLAPGFAIAVGMELYFRAYPNWRDSEATWDSIYLEDVHRKYGVEVLNAKVSEMLSRLRE